MFNAILIFISSSETIQFELFYAVVVTLNVCCFPTQVIHLKAAAHTSVFRHLSSATVPSRIIKNILISSNNVNKMLDHFSVMFYSATQQSWIHHFLLASTIIFLSNYFRQL
jgi:hypothetical protein